MRSSWYKSKSEDNKVPYPVRTNPMPKKHSCYSRSLQIVGVKCDRYNCERQVKDLDSHYKHIIIFISSFFFLYRLPNSPLIRSGSLIHHRYLSVNFYTYVILMPFLFLWLEVKFCRMYLLRILHYTRDTVNRFYFP